MSDVCSELSRGADAARAGTFCGTDAQPVMSPVRSELSICSFSTRARSGLLVGRGAQGVRSLLRSELSCGIKRTNKHAVLVC